MPLKNNAKMRAELVKIYTREELSQAVIENYRKFESIAKVSEVLSRYYGKTIAQYKISDILKDAGIPFKRRSPSIYDAQLGYNETY